MTAFAVLNKVTFCSQPSKNAICSSVVLSISPSLISSISIYRDMSDVNFMFHIKNSGYTGIMHGESYIP